MVPSTVVDRTRHRADDHNAELESLIAAYKKPKIDKAFSLTMGANEIASAFALASLASMSQDSSLAYDSRDVENVRHEEESRYSKEEDPARVSPERRSPVVQRQLSSGSSRSVTFAPGTRHVERKTSRRLSVPPRIKKDAYPQSRMQPRMRRNSDGSLSYKYMPPHWMHHGMNPHGNFIHPNMMPLPPTTAKDWICDFCNIASFSSYEEACMHETTCSVRRHSPQPERSWSPISEMKLQHTFSSQSGSFETHQTSECVTPPQRLPSASGSPWFTGSLSLALPDTDHDWLSPLNCFIRTTCVEAFSANGDYVTSTSTRGRISLQQVGIRCCFCAHRPVNDTSVAAVSFPTSVGGIYESVKRWQRVHLDACQDVPMECRATIAQLASSNTWVPTTRQYWADSAKELGLVDTDDGIRIGVDPNRVQGLSGPEATVVQTLSSIIPRAHNPTPSPVGPTLSAGQPLVTLEDSTSVPPYVHFLISQVVSCRFTEADRFVARSKGPIGYPGFQCRHCNGHAGLGKYFPVSSKSLSTNSTSQNIHAHLLKCRKCPPELKQQLVLLKEEKSKAPRLEPGWRKVFFDMLWSRMHG